MNTKITLRHGFNIIRKMQDAKLQFDVGGRQGYVSFIKASILSGTNYPLLIINNAVRATGEHIRDEIEMILEEGENIHWARNSFGELYVIRR